MRSALEIASEQLTFDAGDFHLLQGDAKKIEAIECPDEKQAQLIDWSEELSEARRPLQQAEFLELATRLFNRQLRVMQERGERLDEVEATPGALKSAYYRRVDEDSEF
jgi:hypothetical protein